MYTDTNIVTAPNCSLIVGDNAKPTLFLAGGISNCGDWQAEMIRMLFSRMREGTSMPDDGWVLLNPRRASYQDTPENARRQIEWEYAHLAVADAVLFWFPKETLCPITLLELGRWSGVAKPLFIGIDPDDARRLDVEVQINLARPYVRPVYSLDDLAELVLKETPEIARLKYGR